MSLTKSDLIDSIHNHCGLSRTKLVQLVESTLEIVKSALESGESVMISGFGKFEVKDKKVRRGRNPQTGDDLMLDARRVVTFKCSDVLREKINGKS